MVPALAASAAPVIQSAVSGDGYVNISWSSVADATGYNIYQSTPGAPANVMAAAGDRLATVSFAVPSDNGGSPITGYIVTSTRAILQRQEQALQSPLPA